MKRIFRVRLLTAGFIILGLVVLLVAFRIISNIPPLSVHVSADRNSVFIGEPVKYSVIIHAEKGINLVLPDIEKDLTGFSVKEKRSQDSVFYGKRIIKREHILKLYKAGEYTVPGIAVKYQRGDTDKWSEVLSPEIKIKVKSLLPEGFEAEAPRVRVEAGRVSATGMTGRVDIVSGGGGVREIEGPIRFPIKEKMAPRGVIIPGELLRTVFSVIGSILLIALTVFIIFKIKARRSVRVLSPAENAMEKLQALKKEDLWDKGRQKEFCAELFSIMVHYVRDRFKIRSAEMTTEELLEEISRMEELAEEDKGYLKELIEACNVIKYTTYLPEKRQRVLDPESALKFVRNTISKEETGVNGS